MSCQFSRFLPSILLLPADWPNIYLKYLLFLVIDFPGDVFPHLRVEGHEKIHLWVKSSYLDGLGLNLARFVAHKLWGTSWSHIHRAYMLKSSNAKVQTFINQLLNIYLTMLAWQTTIYIVELWAGACSLPTRRCYNSKFLILYIQPSLKSCGGLLGLWPCLYPLLPCLSLNCPRHFHYHCLIGFHWHLTSGVLVPLLGLWPC